MQWAHPKVLVYQIKKYSNKPKDKKRKMKENTIDRCENSLSKKVKKTDSMLIYSNKSNSISLRKKSNQRLRIMKISD